MHDALIDLVRAAGDAILDVYRGRFGATSKADGSPLTEADLRGHRVLAAGLAEISPRLPMLSEEGTQPPYAERRRWARYWLVDPLDGTKEFMAKNGEFTVNVALIEAGRPTLGVVGVPVPGAVYVGDCRRGEAYRLDGAGRTVLRTRKMRDGAVTVAASRRHGGGRLADYLDALAERFDVSRKAVGSSLKFCLLAEGEADLYPRLGPTSEWDVAAAHAVLVAAGGAVAQLDGAPLAYNKERLLNPDFVAVADPGYPWFERLPRLPP